MYKFKDLNGDEILIGHQVNVPDPILMVGDLYNNEFTGTVVDFRDDFIVVEDMDGDCFDIEPERVTIVND